MDSQSMILGALNLGAMLTGLSEQTHGTYEVMN